MVLISLVLISLVLFYLALIPLPPTFVSRSPCSPLCTTTVSPSSSAIALPRADRARIRLDCRTGGADRGIVGIRGGVDGSGCDAAAINASKRGERRVARWGTVESNN